MKFYFIINIFIRSIQLYLGPYSAKLHIFTELTRNHIDEYLILEHICTYIVYDKQIYYCVSCQAPEVLLFANKLKMMTFI